jgi:hypothetical protein
MTGEGVVCAKGNMLVIFPVNNDISISTNEFRRLAKILSSRLWPGGVECLDVGESQFWEEREERRKAEQRSGSSGFL